MIDSLAWVLPRLSKSKYIGSFPLHFEKKLLRELNIDTRGPEESINLKILHPFGGKAEFGIRIDLKSEVNPDVVADAHNLPFKDEVFDIVILDPPFNDEYSKRLYDTGNIKLRWGKYTTEAVRVLKDEGYVVVYHYLATPRIENTTLVKRIFLETRVWHKLRCVHIYSKKTIDGGRINESEKSDFAFNARTFRRVSQKRRKAFFGGRRITQGCRIYWSMV